METILAAVTPGILSGVIASDAGNVILTATAVYDMQMLVQEKPFTVTYGLTGPAAGNYTVPTAYSIKPESLPVYC